MANERLGITVCFNHCVFFWLLKIKWLQASWSSIDLRTESSVLSESSAMSMLN